MTAPPEPIGEAAPASQAPAVIELPPPAALAPDEGKPRRRKGRHFGPRPVADPRTAHIDVRCTPAFREKATADAKSAGLTLADYVHIMLGGSPGPRARSNPGELSKALAQLAGQLGKPGSNLNQGSRALNTIKLAAVIDGVTPDRLADLIEEMAELHRQAIEEHRECLAEIMRRLAADDY